MSTHKHGCCADKACNERTCMELLAGSTCGDCKHFRHCEAFYAHKATDTYCDFYPRRFTRRVTDGVSGMGDQTFAHDTPMGESKA